MAGSLSIEVTVQFSIKARSLKHMVLMMILESLSLLRCFLRSLGSAAFVSLSSFVRDGPLMLLRALGQSSMRPRRSELRSSNWSLRSLPLMRWLGILIWFLFPSWLKLPVLSTLFSFREDSVNNGRSNYGISPVREEEDNHVSSGNNEGRLDDDSGSNDVRLDGGIEEQQRRAGKTPGPSTVISHGTDGLESSVQSVMVAFLWHVVDNLGNWERMFEEFDLENVLSNTTSYSNRLKKIANNVRSEFPRLLQLRERNPSLSLEDLKVYCVLLCWSSNKRVDFWSDLSDELLSRADELKKLKKLMLELERPKRNDKIDDKLLSRADELKKFLLELERTWQLHFGEKRNDKIDEEWIDKFNENWRPHFGEKWIDIIDEEWIENFGKKWIDKKIENEEWIDKTIDKWIKNVDPKYKPRGSDFVFVRGLLRFLRNRRHHSDQFQEFHELHSVESLYNYFDALFPCLSMVSYGFSDRFCREEPWFEKYR